MISTAILILSLGFISMGDARLFSKCALIHCPPGTRCVEAYGYGHHRRPCRLGHPCHRGPDVQCVPIHGHGLPPGGSHHDGHDLCPSYPSTRVNCLVSPCRRNSCGDDELCCTDYSRGCDFHCIPKRHH